MTLAAGTRLGPYEIVAVLGAGGMGEVYEARDTRLDRLVAIKILLPEMSADAERRARIEREARTIASLTHPHICTLHDVGSYEGATFLVMERLAGETLAQRLAKGVLPLAQTLEIGSQIAEALDAAHRRGFVHRDLKPGNIMLTNAGAKLLDFGLAKLATELPGATEVVTAIATAPTSPGLQTSAGTALGTAAYMSPEQALGKDVDARSDLFSLGVVLYEMATGRLPFEGETPAALFDKLLHQAPVSPASLNPGLPEALSRMIDKALEKDREIRYQSARELVVDLTRLKRECEAGLAARPDVGAPERIPSLAVLPFANLSADKENEYFSDGLAEDIIDALAQVPGLRVMARTSSFAFRGKEVDARDIGARLNVEHILEGSVRRAGSRIRVTAQLIKARDGFHLWSQRFDREMTDVFVIQDEISQAIVEKLRVRLSGNRPLVKRYTKNVEAYHLLLRGRHCMQRMTRESITKAKAYMEQAIALDHGYALPYVAMAECGLTAAFWGFIEPRKALARCSAAAVEALMRDDTLAEAHIALGAVNGLADFDWAGAEQRLRRGLDLNPGSPDARYGYGAYLLRSMGRIDEALSQCQRAVELDPLSPMFNAFVGYLHYVRGEYDIATEHQVRAIDLDPGSWFPHWLLAVQHEHLGRIEDAVAEAEKACELSGRSAPTVGILGWTYGLAGRRAEAEAILEELTVARGSAYVPAHALAAVSQGLGDVDRTFEWLERGVDERDLLVITGLKTEPRYIPLRGHPRYRALLQKMNLEP